MIRGPDETAGGRGGHGHRVASSSRSPGSLVPDGVARRKPRPAVGRRPSSITAGGRWSSAEATSFDPPRTNHLVCRYTDPWHPRGERVLRAFPRRWRPIATSSRTSARSLEAADMPRCATLPTRLPGSPRPLFPTAHRKARMPSSTAMPQIDACRMTKRPFATRRCRRTEARQPRAEHARLGHSGASRRINRFRRLTDCIDSPCFRTMKGHGRGL